MISEKVLYDKVCQLLKKQFKGFLNGEDFTRSIQTAELEAFEHFVTYFERTQRIADALLPFIARADIQSSPGGEVVPPSNYRHHIRLSHKIIVNTTGEPQVKIRKIRYAASNQVEDMLDDYIDRPDKTRGKYIYTYENGKIQLYEAGSILTVLRYIRTPVFGKIAFTLSETENGITYTHDAENSNALEWPEHVYPLIENLVLEQFGVETREQIIQQYAMLEKQQYMDMAKMN